jgi:hypothetical protein
LQQAEPQDVTSTPSAACTAACTSEAEKTNAGTLDAHPAAGDQNQGERTEQDQGDPLAKLAAALLALSPAERARLAAMLTRGEAS